MINRILIFIGGFIPIIWGSAHLFPTKSVVKGFGAISDDNKQIITMEWIVEGIALIFIGIIVIGVTLIDQRSTVSGFIYIASFLVLNELSIISFFTGFRVHFLPFKCCPIIFSGSSLLIILGYLL